jgi:hypothetical protein
VNVWVDVPVFGVVLKPATKYRGAENQVVPADIRVPGLILGWSGRG